MATVKLTFGVTGKRGAQVILPMSTEILTFTTSAQSAAADGADIVRVEANVDTYVEIGLNPTATANSMKVAANAVEYFAIRPGQEVAAYDGSS